MGSTGLTQNYTNMYERIVREYDRSGKPIRIGYDMTEQLNEFDEKLKATDSQKQALRMYAYGAYGISGKSDLETSNQLSDVIENNKSLHLKDATLFRGVNLDGAEYNQLLQGNVTESLNGLTSWSNREDVAHMYAQGDNMGGYVMRGQVTSENPGHRVIFVEQSTNDAMVLPYTSPQNEALRSKNRVYKITKIVPESKYKKIQDPYSAKYSGYDEPVTYIYVKSKRTSR